MSRWVSFTIIFCVNLYICCLLKLDELYLRWCIGMISWIFFNWFIWKFGVKVLQYLWHWGNPMDYINIWMEWVVITKTNKIFFFGGILSLWINLEILCVYKCRLNICSKLFNSYFEPCKWVWYIPKWMDLKQGCYSEVYSYQFNPTYLKENFLTYCLAWTAFIPSDEGFCHLSCSWLDCAARCGCWCLKESCRTS